MLIILGSDYPEIQENRFVSSRLRWALKYEIGWIFSTKEWFVKNGLRSVVRGREFVE